MKSISRVMLIGVLFICQACATSKLWNDANPNERLWIDAEKTTEAELKQRGVEYEFYSSAVAKGYLIKKSGMAKMKDFNLRMLGTPVTVAVDAASTVVVVGAYMFVTDPDGTVAVIKALSH